MQNLITAQFRQEIVVHIVAWRYDTKHDCSLYYSFMVSKNTSHELIPCQFCRGKKLSVLIQETLH